MVEITDTQQDGIIFKKKCTGRKPSKNPCNPSKIHKKIIKKSMKSINKNGKFLWGAKNLKVKKFIKYKKVAYF